MPDAPSPPVLADAVVAFKAATRIDVDTLAREAGVDADVARRAIEGSGPRPVECDTALLDAMNRLVRHTIVACGNTLMLLEPDKADRWERVTRMPAPPLHHDGT